MDYQSQYTHQLVFTKNADNAPQPGSIDEQQLFEQIQSGFLSQFESRFPDHHAEKTIVVIPSLTLDQEVLQKIEGAIHYEERLLCLLMLLRMPRARIVYVSSIPIDPIIIDYYLHLLPGITGFHASERLTLLSCYDTSTTSLTKKILDRPRLIQKIKQCIPDQQQAHMACFNTTGLEQTLSVQLGIPIYGCNPALNYLGTKSGCRRFFLTTGVNMPPGAENLKTYEELIHAVAGLKDMYPKLKKVVIKMNDGFSGDGNAMLTYPENIAGKELYNWIHHDLIHSIVPVAKDLSAKRFLEQFYQMGGIVEAFVEGEVKISPSVQCRITPTGDVDIISTHNQVLGGDSGQIFIGAQFPADENYGVEIAALGKKIANELKANGVLGRFSIDFISVLENDVWQHYALEINLRKGGTTHPFLMLQFLTNGHFNDCTGQFEMPNKEQCFYYASDNVQNLRYKGLSPKDLIDIVMFHGIHFDGSTQKGVTFHMIGALSQYGKIGLVCIGASHEEAYAYYRKTIEVLDMETAYNA